MTNFKLAGLAGLVSLGMAGYLPASVFNVNIPSTSEIFSAGQAAPNDFMGTLPVAVTGFTPGPGNVLTFNSVTGSVSCGGGCTFVGPNGGTNQGGASTGTNISLTNSGLSPIQFTGREFFLVGVFLDNTVPSGAGPASIGDYGGGTITTTQASYSPVIDQTFFIGTGNNNGQQIFNVPATATRLFLGFADGVPLFNGQAGAYGDNLGSLTAILQITQTITATPEPGTVVLLAMGLAGLALGRRKQLR
jgi:PEP-CTERM motif